MFLYKFLEIIKKIKNISLENIIKINNIKKKNIEKILILENLLKESVPIKYKININNKNIKYENLFIILKNKIKWKYKINFITIFILIILKIKYLNIIINKNKKTNIIYKMCGNVINKINIINLQIKENILDWSIKLTMSIINIIFLYIIKSKR